MGLGNRIADRLDEMQITQADLARRAEMPVTTLNSIIRRESRSSPHLIRIARELRTTPAYLIGETDDPNAGLPDDHLTADERRLVEFSRCLQPGDRQMVSGLLKRLAEMTVALGAAGGTLHDNQHAYGAEG